MPLSAANPDLPLAPREEAPLVRKLSSYVTLTEKESSFLIGLHQPARRYARRREIMIEARHHDHVFLLMSGAVFRYKVLADGRRQALTLGLPGDFIGFPSCLFGLAVNSVAALSDIVASEIELSRLFEVFTRFPRLGAALYWASACDIALYGERLTDIGRRSAYERLAHLLLELLMRLKAVGLAQERSYEFPLTQELMADLLGLSTPHVNRMIRCLREEGLATIEGSRVVIHDLEALESLAGFEERYYQPRPIPGLFQRSAGAFAESIASRKNGALLTNEVAEVAPGY
ncbi:MAG: Crp/Fnr family transcriptional regulator [Acetobacteraceae bacterium]